MTRDEIMQLINAERSRQDIIHPQWKGDYHGLSVLMEEVGEASRGLYEFMNASNIASRDMWELNLEAELIQCAAVCIRWLDNR